MWAIGNSCLHTFVWHYSIPWQPLNSMWVADLRCYLLGLSGGLSKATVTTNCRAALLRTGSDKKQQ